MQGSALTKVQRDQSRLGLALSGGGFRAAFFHIGVLARMAELDLLRHVEVLSTVSGGSVIGAMYYLKVRKLLQERPDNKIHTCHYVRIVSELEREFYDGVKCNLRTRTFMNPCKNWKMYSHSYSRSDRLAELYAKYFFRELVEKCLFPGIPLAKTLIQPAGEAPNFHPFSCINGCTANDRRHNKVPALLINATTLNTGHNFRFTSTWMGEMPTKGARQKIDQNTRLRRAYFSRDKLPEKYEELPLGTAVAASCTVPGVFHPLALTDLYEGWTPQLVDGGVHDNQGIEGLLDSECTHVIASDACGQIEDDPNPGTRVFSVLTRSNSVMMDRIREEIYETVDLRFRSGNQVKELVFLHLRQDLEQAAELTWIGGTKAKQEEQDVGGTISYGVDKNVQVLLSNVRTDLDSFSEVEARSLMADGYLIAKSQINRNFPKKLDPSCAVNLQSDSSSDWEFLCVEPYLKDPDQDPLFSRQLEIAGAITFKVVKRFSWLCKTICAFGVFVAATLLWYLYHMICVDPNKSVAFAYRTAGLTVLVPFAYGLLWLLPSSWRLVVKLRDLFRQLALGSGASGIPSFYHME